MGGTGDEVDVIVGSEILVELATGVKAGETDIVSGVNATGF